MYKSIYVPVDNSDHSNCAVACALGVGQGVPGETGRLPRLRGKTARLSLQADGYTLPEEYIDEVELERQRKIHDSLITMGLKLISDSYLDGMSRLCGESGLEFEPRMMDGKHHIEILKDLAGSQHDLVVIGALGIGRARDSVIGSVCERVARQSDRDVWVVKHVPEPGEPERDTILVGVDGSPQSFGALMTAVDLARTFGKKVEAIAVYDPYLHYSVFNGIVNVLTEQAAKVFRFEEQNQLHEEIIDTGLAQIYQSHLEVGERMGSEAGVAIKKTLLDGKPFQKIIDHARKTNPWLIVLGRIGVHSPKDETSLGSNAENILRAAPCDVLLSTRVEVPRLDVRAEETIRWTPEAEAAHDARSRAGQGDRPHGGPSPGAREGAFGDHERGDRRSDGSVHAEERVGRDQGAGRGRRSRAGEVRPRVDVPGVRRRGHAERRREVHRLRRHGLRGDLAGDDREDRGGGGRSPGGDHLRRAQAPMVGGSQEGPLDHEERLSAPPRQGACRKARAHEEARRDHARIRPTGDRGGDGRAARDPGCLAHRREARAAGRSHAPRRRPAATQASARLIARDDKKNPLISTFDWTTTPRSGSSGSRPGSCGTRRRSGSRSWRGSAPRRRSIWRSSRRDRDRQEDDGRDDRDLPGPGKSPRRRRRFRRRPSAAASGAPSGPGQRERLPQRSEPADGAACRVTAASAARTSADSMSRRTASAARTTSGFSSTR